MESKQGHFIWVLHPHYNPLHFYYTLFSLFETNRTRYCNFQFKVMFISFCHPNKGISRKTNIFLYDCVRHAGLFIQLEYLWKYLTLPLTIYTTTDHSREPKKVSWYKYVQKRIVVHDSCQYENARWNSWVACQERRLYWHTQCFQIRFQLLWFFVFFPIQRLYYENRHMVWKFMGVHGF